MVAHVYQFGTFGSTAPWVYSAIGVALFLITAVHVYRILRKQRARRRRKEPPADALPDACRERLRDGTCGFDPKKACLIHGCIGYQV